MKPQRLTSSQFQAAYDLPDWRIVLSHIEATFATGSFTAAAEFVHAIAAAAEAADHHPDIDLRYPHHVHVSMSTHVAGGLTERDAALATAISALARDAGFASEPRVAQAAEVAIDALDIDAVRPFWQAVLGYVEVPGSEGTVIVDPRRIGPPFWFQQMDAPRPQRNRIHLDVTVAHDEADDRVRAAIAAGGTLLTDEYARSYWVLADPEGNEACVCTWQDRG